MDKRAPDHLSPSAREWFDTIIRQCHTEEHHRRLILLAAQSWDKAEEARKILAKEGIVYHDRFGAPRPPWQIAYLPVYSIWAALVVVMFPPVFGTVDAPSRTLHRRIVLTSRLQFSNCEKCSQLTVEPSKQVERCSEGIVGYRLLAKNQHCTTPQELFGGGHRG